MNEIVIKVVASVILLSTILSVVIEAKQAGSNISSDSNEKPLQTGFYFHQPNANQKKKQPSHLISNRNTANSGVANSANSRLLKQKHQRLAAPPPSIHLSMSERTESAPSAPVAATPHPIQVNVTAKVGETVMLACVVNTAGYNGLNPGVIWMQGNLGNVLTLNTNRITVDQRFEIVQQPLPSQTFQMSHRERPSTPSSSQRAHDDDENIDDEENVSAVEDDKLLSPSAAAAANAQHVNDVNNYYHLKITNVQLYDENEYACETSITRKNEDQPSLHSLVYLHVTQSPSFIESLTSESNLAAVEMSDMVLKCFATGKPLPKIRWYQIEESSGSIRDLNHEANTLTISNISKSDNSKYECVASNGILPSVSKKFTITVYYAPLVKAVLQKTNQYMEQTVALGCVVSSNPESIVSWHKQIAANDSGILSGGLFEPIDVGLNAGQKYQVHKYKQANQTVSYLKIKISEPSDYSKYKCEASNLVGKGDTIIELLELKESPRNRQQIKQPTSPSSSDEDIDIDGSQVGGEYYINLEQGRSKDAAAESNEYQLMGGKNGNQNANRKRPPKMGNLVSNGKNNRTLIKYQMSKTNRIVSTNENGESYDDLDETAAAAAAAAASGDEDEQSDDDIDSEHNTNRINSFLTSDSCGRIAPIFILVSSLLAISLVLSSI